MFVVGNLDGAYGNFNSTVYPPVITLNSATIANRASFEIAKTFMHEMFHAFIYQDAVLTSLSFIDNFREYLSKNGQDELKMMHITEGWPLVVYRTLRDLLRMRKIQ